MNSRAAIPYHEILNVGGSKMKTRLKLTRILTLYAVFALAVLGMTGTVQAGSLDPPGPPAPSMKTLNQIPPSWSQKLPAAERFEVVLDGAAVLDKETGLVWEKSPDSSLKLWADAFNYCQFKEVGGRMGWRMPRLVELQSLVDKTQSNPSLPAGNPFSNVQLSKYWSTSSYVANLWTVDFTTGYIGTWGGCDYAYVWCVRGGTSSDFCLQEPGCTD